MKILILILIILMCININIINEIINNNVMCVMCNNVILMY